MMLKAFLALLPLANGLQHFFCDSHIEPIVVKGNRFFDSNGDYFPVKGIAYYPRPNAGILANSNSVDLFTDEYEHLWGPDVENFKRLGINTVRIYAVDPSKPHDRFMCALQAAGIYVIIGLLADCENCAVGIEPPPTCYPARLKNRGQWIINVFSKYTNTLAFSAGNEATIFADNNINAPCQKKFLRDMIAFRHKCRQVPNSILPRDIPIGMVNWDFEREAQTKYFNCREGTDEFENAEWYGLNAYQHCDPAATSPDQLWGWRRLRDDFASYNLPNPTVIAEYGCRNGGFPKLGQFEAQRNWLQVDAIHSYTDVFAGGVVFEYSAEKRQVEGSRQGKPFPYYEYMQLQYGVGYYFPEDCNHNETRCSYNEYPEFDLLAQKYKGLVFNEPSMEEFTPTGQIPECPANLYPPLADFTWESDTSPDEVCYVVWTDSPTGPPGSATAEPTASPVSQPTDAPVPKPTAAAEPTATAGMPETAAPVAVPTARADPTAAPTKLKIVQAEPTVAEVQASPTDKPNDAWPTPLPTLTKPPSQSSVSTGSTSSALRISAFSLVAVVVLLLA